jgi:hypothetical protein
MRYWRHGQEDETVADGTIVIDTELKTDKLKNKLDKLNNDIERQTGKVKELQAEYDRLLSGEGAPAENPAVEKLNKQLEKAKGDLTSYYAELERINQSTDIQLKSAEAPEMVENILQVEQVEVEQLNAKYAKQLATVQRIEAELNNTPATVESTAGAAEDARLRLERARIELERMQVSARGVDEQLRNTGSDVGNTQRNLNSATKALKKFEKRLVTMAKKVFVFSLVLAALRKVKAYMGEALKTNEEFQASYANLKGTLMTAFQPILTAIIPIIKALINVLNVAANAVAKFTSWIFGTTVEASQKAAKALYDQSKATKAAGTAAEKAKKQMSGLDEMNTWQSEKSSGGGGTADVSADPFSGVKDELGEMEVYVSGALLAIGAILAFTGVSIPLGIALMAIGAAGLASAIVPNWGSMSDEMQTAITNVLVVLGTAALVIGAILTFTAAHVALGIGLMIAGAGLLGTAVALNWNTIKEKLQGSLGAIVAIVSVALLVIGIILAVACPVALPLGIALILAGAAGLATTVAVNWDTLKSKIQTAIGKILAVASKAALVIGLILTVTGVAFPLGIALILAGAKGMAKYAPADWNALLKKIQSVWSSIKTWFNKNVAPKFTTKYWGNKFSSIKTALTSKIKGALNAGIALLNRFINWINAKMNLKWGSFKILGKEVIPKGSFQLLKLNNIPYLAQGGVIPANREFLAVLGDQKHGNNIEAPESLIRQIVREESGGNDSYTFVAQLNGRTIFREVIDQAKLSRKMTGKNAFVTL